MIPRRKRTARRNVRYARCVLSVVPVSAVFGILPISVDFHGCVRVKATRVAAGIGG